MTGTKKDLSKAPKTTKDWLIWLLNTPKKDGDRTMLFFARLSAVWILFMLGLLIFQRPSKDFELNEMGDFLAGFMAPLAFLWLILGYFQQARAIKIQANELAASVEALKMQSKELEASVKEQKKMVEATGRLTEIERKRRMREAEAGFVGVCDRAAGLKTGKISSLKLRVKPEYKPASNVVVQSKDGDTRASQARLSVGQFLSWEEHDVLLRNLIGRGVVYKIRYRDHDGVRVAEEVRFWVNSNDHDAGVKSEALGKIYDDPTWDYLAKSEGRSHDTQTDEA